MISTFSSSAISRSAMRRAVRRSQRFSGLSPALPTRSPRFRRWAGRSAPSASPPPATASTKGIRTSLGCSKFATIGFSGQLDWNLGFAKLTSITAWRDNTIVSGQDTDYTSIDLLYEPATQGNATDFKQFSEELRLAGKEGPLDWLVGAFFASEILTPNMTLWAGKDLDLYLGGLASASVGPPNFLLIPGLTGKSSRRYVRSRAWPDTAITFARPRRAMRSLRTRPTRLPKGWI